MWETLYGMVLAYPIVCFVFVPVYFSLGITSVYQYLDMRFKSRLVRCLASGTYVVRQLLNQGVTVYTPCVALNTVIGIPYWASIVGISLVSIIFNILVSLWRNFPINGENMGISCKNVGFAVKVSMQNKAAECDSKKTIECSGEFQYRVQRGHMARRHALTFRLTLSY